MPPVSSEKTCSQGGELTQISAEKVGKSVQHFLGKLGLPYSHAYISNREHFLKICIPSPPFECRRRSQSHSSLTAISGSRDIYLVQIAKGADTWFIDSMVEAIRPQKHIHSRATCLYMVTDHGKVHSTVVVFISLAANVFSRLLFKKIIMSKVRTKEIA